MGGVMVLPGPQDRRLKARRHGLTAAQAAAAAWVCSKHRPFPRTPSPRGRDLRRYLDSQCGAEDGMSCSPIRGAKGGAIMSEAKSSRGEGA